MKRLIWLFVVLGLLTTAVPQLAFANGDIIDISHGTVTITGKTTFRVSGILVEGWPGYYWGDFAFDNQAMQFVLTASGEDADPNVWALDIALSMTSRFKLTLTANQDRTINVKAEQVIGMPYFFWEKMQFWQNGQKFFLQKSNSSDSVALYEQKYGNADGSMPPPTNTTNYNITGRIYNVPFWFDEASPFTLIYNGVSYQMK